MITVHGIPNCDQIRKTLAWFKAEGVEVAFHDYKKAGIDAATLGTWAQAVGWEKLVNRAGTTWRKLDDATKAGVTSEAKAIPLLVAQPSLIKRPVVTSGRKIVVGYDPDAFAGIAGK